MTQGEREEWSMILRWFEASGAKAFGSSLATFYIERVPVEVKLTEKQFTAKSREVLAKMTRQVQDYKTKNKVGIYRKAQIGNAFRWTLKDAGYDDEYIRRLTLWLMTSFE